MAPKKAAKPKPEGPSWYKYEFHHGPGHQGTHIEYHWYETPPGDEYEREVMEEIANAQYMNGWVCNCDPIEALPEDVRREKIRAYWSNIEHAQRMLKVLGAPSERGF